jgi:hypothetical protein
MHDKILTTDNLQKMNWPHQEHCVLCNGPQESGLCFASSQKPFWDQLLLEWENFVVQWTQQELASIVEWWEQAASKIQKQGRRRINGIVIYIMWNL